MNETTNTTAKAVWDKLSTDSGRSAVIDRARECAKLTVPTLFPEGNNSDTDKYETPFQSLGARAVNNLASKLLLALFPPNTPFFRFYVEDEVLEQTAREEGALEKLEKLLGRAERKTIQHFETMAGRVAMFKALRLLVVTGNALIHVDKETKKIRVFNLNSYVVRRSSKGELLELVIKETLPRESIPEDVLAALTEERRRELDNTTNATVDLYTHILKEGDKYTIKQEVEGITVKGTTGDYTPDELPYIALRWVSILDEDYGRGHVEEYIGDLRSLEGLRQAIVEGSAAAAKVLFLVNPNGTTKVRALSKSRSGDIVAGNAQDVSVLQLDKYADFRVAQETSNEIKMDLAQAFLLNSAVQRDAERVTAEEIRYMASELEDALGGIYSVLSQELQAPLVKLLVKYSNLDLPDNVVEPVITTGLEALGRGHDLQKLQLALGTISQFGAEAMAYISMPNLIDSVFTSLGIDTAGIIKSEQEVQQEREQAAMVQALSTGSQAAMESLGKQAPELLAQQTQDEGGQQ